MNFCKQYKAKHLKTIFEDVILICTVGLAHWVMNFKNRTSKKNSKNLLTIKLEVIK